MTHLAGHKPIPLPLEAVAKLCEVEGRWVVSTDAIQPKPIGEDAHTNRLDTVK